jgi:hypothetical protein
MFQLWFGEFVIAKAKQQIGCFNIQSLPRGSMYYVAHRITEHYVEDDGCCNRWMSLMMGLSFERHKMFGWSAEIKRASAERPELARPLAPGFPYDT